MRTTDASGTTFEVALKAALADLLDCDTEKVEVRLDAPGLEDLDGRLRLELDIRSIDAHEPALDESGDDEFSDDHGTATSELDEDRDATAAELDEDRDATAAELDEDREGPDDGPAPRPPETVSVEELDEEAEAAADFVEGLLDAMELPGDLRIKIHDDHAEVEVLEVGSGALIGRRGQTLEAIQELARCALQREFQRRSRVKIDAEGYRARRLEKLLEKAEEVVEDVLSSGQSQRLEPMDVFERKAIHHLVAEHEGVMSRSQGREPARRVIIERE